MKQSQKLNRKYLNLISLLGNLLGVVIVVVVFLFRN